MRVGKLLRRFSDDATAWISKAKKANNDFQFLSQL